MFLVLTKIEKHPLSYIAKMYHKNEGFSSPHEFIEYLKKIFRGHEPQLDKEMYLHFFEKADITNINGLKINVPLKKEMKKAILDGKKNCTTRNYSLGMAGDWFEIEEKNEKTF